jgi:hypothetical protein
VVKTGHEREFEQIYGRDGLWCNLLRFVQSGYRGCELIARRPQLLELWDYWTSHLEFEAFRGRQQRSVQTFQAWVNSLELIEREEVLGMFYQGDRGPDADDETGLVPV